MLSPLELLQMGLVCLEWAQETKADLPMLCHLSIQSTRLINTQAAPMRGLVHFVGGNEAFARIMAPLQQACSTRLIQIDVSNLVIGENNVEALLLCALPHCPKLKSLNMSGCTESDILRALSCLALVAVSRLETPPAQSRYKQLPTPPLMFSHLQNLAKI